jgi:hypothetical protein
MKKIFFRDSGIFACPCIWPERAAFYHKSKLTNIKGPATAYLVYYLGANSVTDSATVSNGEFKFDGVVMDPVNASLFIDHKNIGFCKICSPELSGWRPFKNSRWLFFSWRKAQPKYYRERFCCKADITGSLVNDDNKNLKAQLKVIIDKAQKITLEGQKATLPSSSGRQLFKTLCRLNTKYCSWSKKQY